MLTSSIALLFASAGPWLLQIPMPEATPIFKDSLAEPSSQLLMLIGCGTLATYGLLKRLRAERKSSAVVPSYSVSKRHAA
ncbi:MAG TPA: hypothetical protein VGM76_15445 [Lacipirellulaceae bacterium]